MAERLQWLSCSAEVGGWYRRNAVACGCAARCATLVRVKQPEKKLAVGSSLTPSLESDSSGAADELLDVSVPSVSGFYIALAEQGKLQQLPGLLKKRYRLCREVADVTAKLQDINNPGWLAMFGGGRPNFATDLPKRAARLEEVKSKKSSQLAQIEAQIRRIDPALLEIEVPAETDSSGASRAIGPQENWAVAKRNQLIQKHARTKKSHLAICKALDLELAEFQDAPPIGVPQKWVQEFGNGWKEKYKRWNFYEAAYRDPRTKNRMQKMISVAKAR
jgi:hypothetical protein